MILIKLLFQILEAISVAIERVDRFLLDSVEPIAHFLQRLTGKDCFWFAELLIYVNACLMMLISIYAIVMGQISAAEGAVDCIFFTGMFVAFLRYMLHRRKSGYQKNPGFMNPSRIDPSDQLFRMLWLFLLAGDGRKLFAADDPGADLYMQFGSSVTIALFLYLIACTPLPPGKSLIHKLIEKAREALTPNPDALPDPVPS